jgi:hypothetical protein
MYKKNNLRDMTQKKIVQNILVNPGSILTAFLLYPSLSSSSMKNDRYVKYVRYVYTDMGGLWKKVGGVGSGAWNFRTKHNE